jgi:hypothetical protein
MDHFLPLREPITGKSGCPTAVRALRECFQLLLADHTDFNFTGRLMQIVAEILRRDEETEGGKRSIFFSREMPFLSTIVFNKKYGSDNIVYYRFNYSHSETRAEARVSIVDCSFRSYLVPGGATHFRVLNHLSIISDYCYSESSRMYEPMSRLNGMSVIGYSDYMQITDSFSVDVVVSFPVWCHPSEDDSVIQCMGIVYYVKSGMSNYLSIGKRNGVVICDVF